MMGKLLTVFLVILFMQCAKSTPTSFPGRQELFARAASLDNGISISWLEQTWNTGVLDRPAVSSDDLVLLKKLGFKSIRLPVAFEYFENTKVPVNKVMSRIDEVWKLCRKYNLKLIIDYHYGALNGDNYITETQRIIKVWNILTRKYRGADAKSLFFEIYNEPPPINPQVWKDAAYNIVNAIHKIDPQRTLLVGASNFNSIYELSRFTRLPDENVIYTVHFYEPFLFTHQGAAWVGDQVATTGVPFPYNVEKFPALNPKAKNTPGESHYNLYKTDGNEQSVMDKLQIVKNWSDKYYVPVICSEYGVYNQYSDLDSRCRYIKTVRSVLKQLRIPGVLWEYNSNFSIFNGLPSVNTLPDCMRIAIGYHDKTR